MVANNHPIHSSQACQEICRDIKTLLRFIEIYCHGHHHAHHAISTHTLDEAIQDILGRNMDLCPDCAKLAKHAFVKRCVCPMNPKPLCKHCPNHCYHPKYRAMIRKVMKYSGIKMLCRGRLDYLLHLIH